MYIIYNIISSSFAKCVCKKKQYIYHIDIRAIKLLCAINSRGNRVKLAQAAFFARQTELSEPKKPYSSFSIRKPIYISRAFPSRFQLFLIFQVPQIDISTFAANFSTEYVYYTYICMCIHTGV